MNTVSISSSNLPYEKIGKNEPVCIADEVPFEIPESWEWVRLSDLVSIYTGKKDANFGNPKGEYDFFTCSNEPIKSSTYSYDGEYLIMPGNGANIGLVIYYNGKFEAYQRTYLLENINHINLNYLKYHLEFNWKAYNADKMYGSAIPYIKLGNLQNYLVAFPPANEQLRIVDTIERYIPLVNSYEKKEIELANLNQNFPDILKKSILQQAVMGKLVPQDENDEPASVLLDRIRAEKQALMKAGKLKKDKHESVIYKRDNSHYEKLDDVERCIDDEIPFDIPDSWEWVRLGSLFILLSGTDFKPEQYNDRGDGIPYITGASNLGDQGVIINRWTEFPQVIAERGDVLLVCKGSGYGRTVICNIDSAHIARQIMSFKLMKSIKNAAPGRTGTAESTTSPAR